VRNAQSGARERLGGLLKDYYVRRLKGSSVSEDGMFPFRIAHGPVTTPGCARVVNISRMVPVIDVEGSHVGLHASQQLQERLMLLREAKARTLPPEAASAE